MNWISVDERLPEIPEGGDAIAPHIDIWVIVADVKHKVFLVGCKDGEFIEISDEYLVAPYWRITHWMPLPEAPKESQTKKGAK
jgi:hypothetical protein